MKDALLRATHSFVLLAQEAQNGHGFTLKRRTVKMTRLLIPELETVHADRWTYLVERPHEWRRQLYVKGRKLLASTVWADMRANGMSLEEAADNWDLPVQAVQEIVRYCETYGSLLIMESAEEAKRLIQNKETEHAPASVS